MPCLTLVSAQFDHEMQRVLSVIALQPFLLQERPAAAVGSPDVPDVAHPSQRSLLLTLWACRRGDDRLYRCDGCSQAQRLS